MPLAVLDESTFGADRWPLARPVEPRGDSARPRRGRTPGADAGGTTARRRARRATAVRWSPPARWSGSGSTRPRCPPTRPRRARGTGRPGRRRRGGVRRSGSRRRARRRSSRRSSCGWRMRPIPRRTPVSTAPSGSTDELPLAPTRDFAAAVLGTVGAATAELVEELRRPWSRATSPGCPGCRSATTSSCAGDPAWSCGGDAPRRTGARGRARAVPDASPSTAPRWPPRSTSGCSAWPRRPWRRSGRPARSSRSGRPTGEVLAAASGPGWVVSRPRRSGQFAPGSTFKVVTSLGPAAGRADRRDDGVLPADDHRRRQPVQELRRLPEPPARRDHPAEAVANSCNTAMIGERAKCAAGRPRGRGSRARARRRPDLGYPVFLGSVPTDAKSETEHAASIIGQGRVEASPVAMAAVAASVAARRDGHAAASCRSHRRPPTSRPTRSPGRRRTPCTR